MEIHAWLFCSVLILWNLFIYKVNGRLNFVVKKFELCNPNVDYPNKIYATIHTVNNIQYVDGNATIRVAVADDIRSNFTAELLVGKKYIEIVKFEELRTCKSIHRYMGEFAYEMERTAALVPGLCPIPPGRYHIHNYTLHFNRMTLQNYPFGHLRFRAISTDRNNKLICCLTAEVENVS